MADGDTRRWSLRNPGAEISNNNIPTSMLLQWAERGIIKPGCTLSADGETWLPADALPELGMTWYIIASGRNPYGPITHAAAERFIADGHFPSDALITEDPGEEPVSMELPLPMELPPDTHLQELEETRKRLVLLEKELRLKDRRIDELRQEAEARQAELNVDGTPDLKTLAGELESLRLERNHLKRSAEEAAESAAARERELRQRIHSLETALETAQNALPESVTPPDETLFRILSREAELLRQSQNEEERFIDQLRELSRVRMVQLSERLLEIRRLAGDSPETMRTNAQRTMNLPRTPQLSPVRKEDSGRINLLEKELADARLRESDLQRRLVMQEGRETQLRSQITRAERQTLDSLKLDEKLRETVQALEREQLAREEEHRENAHIQAQLLRRIEELERLSAQGIIAAPQPAVPVHELPEQEPERPSFGWLRKRP